MMGLLGKSVIGAALLGTGCTVYTDPAPAAPPPPAVSAQVTVATPPPAYGEAPPTYQEAAPVEAEPPPPAEVYVNVAPPAAIIEVRPVAPDPGYIWVDGYWDWPYDLRGLVFAPVYFNQPVWLNAGWRYRPTFVVGFNSFFDSAFVGPGGGYYFGNYYSPASARAGYQPRRAGCRSFIFFFPECRSRESEQRKRRRRR